MVWTKACILSYESASNIVSSHSLDTQQFGLAAIGGTKYGAAVLAEKWLSPKGAGTVAINLMLMQTAISDSAISKLTIYILLVTVLW